jgi:hypothetical protein
MFKMEFPPVVKELHDSKASLRTRSYPTLLVYSGSVRVETDPVPAEAHQNDTAPQHRSKKVAIANSVFQNSEKWRSNYSEKMR